MSRDHYAFLDAGHGSAAESSSGYDSEAAAPTKGSRARRAGGRADHAVAKRRKISPAPSAEEEGDEVGGVYPRVVQIEPDFQLRDDASVGGRGRRDPGAIQHHNEVGSRVWTPDAARATGGARERESGEEWGAVGGVKGDGEEEEEEEEGVLDTPRQDASFPTKTRTSSLPWMTKSATAKTRPTRRPGVIYLSSLPPYLKPSALRNLLQQRGFGPITRLFLSPAAHSKASGRQLYTEGWLELASHRTAKLCVQTLNAAPVGGKKGGFYRDDVWNMRYLKGMAWEGLMEGVRGERREAEARRDEERRVMRREDRVFVEGVERAKRERTMEGKKRKKRRRSEVESGEVGVEGNGDVDVKRTWRQYESKGKGGHATSTEKRMPDEVKEVLAKIF